METCPQGSKDSPGCQLDGSSSPSAMIYSSQSFFIIKIRATTNVTPRVSDALKTCSSELADGRHWEGSPTPSVPLLSPSLLKEKPLIPQRLYDGKRAQKCILGAFISV